MRRKIFEFCGDELLSATLSLIIIIMLSIGIQSLLFLNKDYGWYLDIGVFALILIFVARSMLCYPITFPFKGTRGRGTIAIVAACLCLICIYIYIAYPSPTICWGWLAVFLGVLLLALSVLKDLGTHIGIMCVCVGVGLFYCLGTYCAICFHGLESSASVYDMTFLSVVALFVWFKSVFE